ncbi:serine/arginine-rich splicing factor 5-like isoform X2 [Protopterus annectens]|nr:serine/arginine-rich splicing factor 5-like isoform X2 [Protopterus annectens]
MSGCRVFIGRLNPAARERDVEKFFKGYGRLRDIDLKRGFGFVEFDDPRDADDAVYELDGKELCNERVTIEHARAPRRGGFRGGRGGYGGGGSGGGNRFSDRYGSRRPRNEGRRSAPPPRTENRLIVENLSSRVSWQDLKDFMRQAGEVTFADAHRPKLNEGVVEFASYSDLKTAMEKLNGKEINGRKIRLIEGYKKRSRSKSRSRSRSSSRSRSRSRSPSRRSYSRSRSRSASKSPSRSPAADKSPKRASSASHSKSPSPQPRSRSHSRSRSRSADSRN